jgi:hypothetical protein
MTTPAPVPPPPPVLDGPPPVPPAERAHALGRRALALSGIGWVLALLLVGVPLLSSLGGLGPAILGFLLFPLAELTALVMGLMAARSNFGRGAAALSLIGLAGWGYFLYQFLNTPLRLF